MQDSDYAKLKQEYEKQEAEHEAMAKKTSEGVHSEEFASDYRLSGDFVRVADFLGVDNVDDSQINSRIMEIAEWAESTVGEADVTKMVSEIKALVDRLGLTVKGDELVRQLFKWVTLDNEHHRIDEEKEILENRPKLESERVKAGKEFRKQVEQAKAEFEKQNQDDKKKTESMILSMHKRVKEESVPDNIIQLGGSTPVIW
jgi:hypothetical protein